MSVDVNVKVSVKTTSGTLIATNYDELDQLFKSLDKEGAKATNGRSSPISSKTEALSEADCGGISPTPTVELDPDENEKEKNNAWSNLR